MEYRKFLDICGEDDFMSLSFAGLYPFLDQFRWRSVEIDADGQEFEKFTRFARWGPTYGYNPRGGFACVETSPRYRLNGSKIEDYTEYSANVATRVLIDDVHRFIRSKIEGLSTNNIIIEYGTPTQWEEDVVDGFATDGNFLFISTQRDGFSIRHTVSMWVRPIIEE